MNITVPVSVGEVIDKVTILEIKSEKISDSAKLKNVETELEALRPLVGGGVFDSDEMVELTNGLRRVNGEFGTSRTIFAPKKPPTVLATGSSNWPVPSTSPTTAAPS